jgi:hypothetical protein
MGVPPAVLVNTIKGSLIGEMSNSVLIFIVVAIGASVLLRKTVWGRKVELIGLNPTAAHFAGVDVERTITIPFGLNGVLAAIAGIMSAGYTLHHAFAMGYNKVGVADCLSCFSKHDRQHARQLKEAGLYLIENHYGLVASSDQIIQIISGKG